ncbi:MAG: S-adenosylmethionine tRNA ribosyltransferase [Bacteroidetes bacterium HGW-Bacteroidetes-1]|jgi:S-adenosylmethionine:tRNA ribosyltransferase-isomerase|nr:MAG: S-adenosylmethionine tRNA ribosyltransferase [Bacteroidetes bacterium HGW-Bacteroidetes-1]
MESVKKIQIQAYNYDLPDHRIAKYPLDQREQSKLLLCLKGKLSQDQFANIINYLPVSSLLVSNETKVVNARLRFIKTEGAAIELFCLEPETSQDFQLAFSSCSPVIWKCLVGNSKRWKNGLLSKGLIVDEKKLTMKAVRVDQRGDHSIIRFEWDGAGITFGQILDAAGDIPLPPYLNRKAELLDQFRYQTVFARNEGSVAAPTAGLHFTEEIINNLKNKDISFSSLTLHVGAGTFKPVSTNFIGDHHMHSEHIFVERKTIQQILDHCNNSIIAVGTTSMRTLESLYWLGVMIHKNPDIKNLHLDQWYPYESKRNLLFSARESLQVLIDYLDTNHLNYLSGSTALMIAPGYQCKIVKGLITNFHQPKSTLLLLVSALVGEHWKDAYHFALMNDFRFLSYGDSCLFIP